MPVSTPFNVLSGGSTTSGGGSGTFTSILLNDGSASAPSLSFRLDTNTGVYRVGADSLGFSTGGALCLNLDSAGSSIFSPSGIVNSVKLGSTSAYGVFSFNNDIAFATACGIAAKGSGGDEKLYVLVPDTAGTGFYYKVGNNTRFFIDRNGAGTFSGLVTTPASTTSTAGLNLPHGAAPSSPVNGDMWTTTAGLFVRINGVTKTVTLT